MKIFYCNIRGLKSKTTSLEAVLDQTKPDIIVIAETQIIGRSKVKIQNYNINGEANRNTKSGGILIGTRKNSDIETVILKKDAKNQQIWAIIRTKTYSFRICIVYGYSSEERVSQEELEEWYVVLEEEYMKQMEYDTIIIGDFNAHTGSDELPINLNGKNLNALIERRNLININNLDICNGKYTREDKNGTKTIIDYAIADENIINKIKEMYIDDQHRYKMHRYRKINNKCEEIATDHNPIIIKLEVEIGKKKEKVTRWNFNNKECLEKFQRETNNINMKEEWGNEGDIDTKYKKWEKQIKGLMYKCFNKITLKEKATNTEVKGLIQIKRKLNQKISEIQNLNIKSNIVITKLRQRKTELIEEITTKINQSRGKRNKRKLDEIAKGAIKDEIWQVRKKNITKTDNKHAVKDLEGKILTTKESILLRYQEYYKNLLQNREIPNEYKNQTKLINETFQHRMMITKYDHLPINQEFTEKELNRAIKTMKTGKAPGPDNITYELLINAGPSLRKNLLKMINYFWVNENIPSKLKTLYIKSMYKGKGDICELENQRGLFLSSTIIKFYEKMMYNRAYPMTENHGFSEYQSGGRKKHSPTDQVFIIRTLQEYYMYRGKPYFIEFCDLQKAFDKMILKNVMDNLWNSEARGRIWRNIYEINKNTDAIIKTPYGETEKINISEILKQGSVLASTLAALHTDSSTKFKQEELGARYGDIHIHSLLFQDDIARIETDAEKLNAANKIYEIFQDINGMLFHKSKTVYISNTQNNQINLNDKQVNQVKSTKYLGDIITDNGKLDENIEDRRLKINGVVAEIRSIMMEAEEDLEILAAIQYYEGIVKTKLIYNCESWINITKSNMEELEKIQNNSLKRLLRIPFSTPSVGLLYELKIPSIKTSIIQRKLMYYHKLLNTEKSLAASILKQQDSIQSNHFLKEIKQALHDYKINNEIKEIQEMSKNQWKKIVQKSLNEFDESEIKKICEISSKCKNLTNSTENRRYINELDSANAKIILMEKLNMTDVKLNYKGSYTSFECRTCGKEDENTTHLLNCPELGSTDKRITEIHNNLKDNNSAMLPGDLKSLAQCLLNKITIRDKLVYNTASNSSIDADNH